MFPRRAPEDLTGQKFSRMTVLSMAPKVGDRIAWNCACECGGSKIVSSANLKRGQVKSCGCYRNERVRETNSTHGKSHTRVYRIWRDMRNRCHYRKYPEWHLYGGRGIVVCDRWRNSFEAFLADMGEPADHLSIDRINVNGNYEPGNCRWATTKEQQANKRPQ